MVQWCKHPITQMIDEHMAVVHHGQSKDDIEQQHPAQQNYITRTRKSIMQITPIVTESAKTYLQEMLIQHKKQYVRLAVNGGGCSGIQVRLGLYR